MSKGVYYKIDCDECRRLGLSGTDKDVYFFVKSFKGGLTMGQQHIAEYLCMGNATLRRSLQRLIDRGLVVAGESEQVYNGGRILVYRTGQPTLKMSEGVAQNEHGGEVKMSEGIAQNERGGVLNLGEGPIYNETSNRTSNKQVIEQSESSRAREEEQARGGVVESVEVLARELKNDMATQTMTSESARRMYGLTNEQLVEAVGMFEDKLIVDGVNYKPRSDFRRHFNSWLRLNVKSIFFNGNGNKQYLPGTSISAEYLAKQLDGLCDSPDSGTL